MAISETYTVNKPRVDKKEGIRDLNISSEILKLLEITDSNPSMVNSDFHLSKVNKVCSVQ